MQSVLNLKDFVFDLFDKFEIFDPIFELSKRSDNYRVMPEELDIAEREYISIYLRADSEKRIYKREGYDILTFFGDIGGLFDIVLIFGWAMTTFFAGKVFTAALISKVYNVQNYFRDSSEFYETKKTHKLTTESESVSSVYHSKNASIISNQTSSRQLLNDESAV